MIMFFEGKMIFYIAIDLEKNLKVKYNLKKINVWDIIRYKRVC